MAIVVGGQMNPAVMQGTQNRLQMAAQKNMNAQNQKAETGRTAMQEQGAMQRAQLQASTQRAQMASDQAVAYQNQKFSRAVMDANHANDLEKMNLQRRWDEADRLEEEEKIDEILAELKDDRVAQDITSAWNSSIAMKMGEYYAQQSEAQGLALEKRDDDMKSSLQTHTMTQKMAEVKSTNAMQELLGSDIFKSNKPINTGRQMDITLPKGEIQKNTAGTITSILNKALDSTKLVSGDLSTAGQLGLLNKIKNNELSEVDIGTITVVLERMQDDAMDPQSELYKTGSKSPEWKKFKSTIAGSLSTLYSLTADKEVGPKVSKGISMLRDPFVYTKSERDFYSETGVDPASMAYQKYKELTGQIDMNQIAQSLGAPVTPGVQKRLQRSMSILQKTFPQLGQGTLMGPVQPPVEGPVQ